MLFNSYSFIFVFLPITLGGFFLAAGFSKVAAGAWMVAMSLVFYAMWNPPFVLLLVFSILCNFACGLAITRAALTSTRRRNLVRLGVTANLLLLGVFKYTNFFLGTIGGLAQAHWNLPTMILPLGISFYTFTQIAFLVDAADGLVAEVSLLRYFVFVSYFPHLIAGPVIHHRQVMSQFKEEKTYHWNWEAISLGLTVFAVGLAKKVLIADGLAQYADGTFSAAAQGLEPEFFGAWAGALTYTFQLYFDFSGYSDMAIGLSLLFNVRLPVSTLNRRFLATLAYHFVRIPAGLFVYSTGWKQERAWQALRQFDADDALRRPLAWRELDLRRLGSAARHLLADQPRMARDQPAW